MSSTAGPLPSQNISAPMVSPPATQTQQQQQQRRINSALNSRATTASTNNNSTAPPFSQPSTTTDASALPHPPAPGAAAAASTPQTGHTVAQIFQFQGFRVNGVVVPPRLNETQPVSLFWYADKHLTKAVEALQKVRDIDSDKFKRRNERVHRAQRLLLETLYLVYSDMDERHKASRAYRRQLPPEDQRELEGGFSENILFAAQALSCGFRIRGIEEYTQELYEPARQLHVAIEALRLAFCRRALGCPSPPYEDLFPVLRDFDRAWTAFEQKICFCYFSVTYSGRPGRSDDLDMFQVLMSETIIRAVRNSYITWAQVHAFDPLVMFAVPRLCIVAALHHMPDCIDVTDGEHGFRWFRSKASLLRRLQSELNLIGGAKIILLEKLLVDSDNHADEHADVDEGPAEMVVQESAEEEKEHHMMIPPAAEGKPVERTPSEIEPRESGETTELERAPSEIEPRESGETTELQPILYPGRSPSPLRRTFPLDQALVMAQSQKYDTLQLAQLSINGSGSAAARREFPLAPVRATLHELYVDICRVADDLQSGPQAREFVSILHKVFTMHQEEADAGPAAATNRAPAAAGMVAT